MFHRCLPARYGLAAATAVAVTSLALLTTPADAVPTPSNCSTDVWGVTDENQLVHRQLSRGVPVEPDAVAQRPLTFTPTSVAYEALGRSAFNLLTLNTDRTPRMVRVSTDFLSGDVTWSSRPLANRNFRHRLLAGSKHSYFAVDPSGTLRRWYLLRNADGKQHLGGSQVVRRGMGGLKTLSYHYTFDLRGQQTAILFATTRSGALMQIRVVDRDLRRRDDPVGKVQVVRLRERGFGGYTAASLSTCNSRIEYPALTYIDSRGDLAQLYSLGNSVWKPEAKNLVNRGPAGKDKSWRIRATA